MIFLASLYEVVQSFKYRPEVVTSESGGERKAREGDGKEGRREGKEK